MTSTTTFPLHALCESTGIAPLSQAAKRGHPLPIQLSTEDMAAVLSGVEYLAYEAPRTKHIKFKKKAKQLLRMFDPTTLSPHGPTVAALIAYGRRNPVSLAKYRKQINVYYTYIHRSQTNPEPLLTSLSQLDGSIVFALRNMYSNLVDGDSTGTT